MVTLNLGMADRAMSDSYPMVSSSSPCVGASGTLAHSESWVRQKKNESRINVVEMWSLRSMCGVPLKDRCGNSDVRNRCGLKEVEIGIEKGMLRREVAAFRPVRESSGGPILSSRHILFLPKRSGDSTSSYSFVKDRQRGGTTLGLRVLIDGGDYVLSDESHALFPLKML
ncbi:hypothetical protein EVAR_96300_1 [Eumeta japonica]|uniref:Uncharacterized protein n=1 Tax=Eumeta variegata TaxID=151549 RepID=A0A4C1VXH0_EUMVA|nr:hypothetical protein EVAR_96300_1 [Eumeta japonica]